MQFLWHFLSQTPSEYKSERYQSFLSYFYSLLDPTNTASVIQTEGLHISHWQYFVLYFALVIIIREQIQNIDDVQIFKFIIFFWFWLYITDAKYCLWKWPYGWFALLFFFSLHVKKCQVHVILQFCFLTPLWTIYIDKMEMFYTFSMFYTLLFG